MGIKRSLENILKSAKIAALMGFMSFTNNLYSKDINIPADYQRIQEGIDASLNGDRVIVSSGTYNEVIDFKGKAIALKSSDGAEKTIIDGSGLDDSVIKCISGESSDTILDEFTITKGAGKSLEGLKCGGGMVNLESSPTVSNCIFLENIVGAGPSGSIGGGMYNKNSNSNIKNCDFISNQANNGAGIRNDNSNVTIENCRFLSNTSFNGGGGLVNTNSSSIIKYCVFANNNASGDGGALFNNGKLELINCTIAKNSSRDGGGLLEAGQSTIINSIFYANSGSPILGRNGGNALVSYSNFQGGYSHPQESGNIDANPIFLDEANNDFHLQSNSPCIDVGDPTLRDLDGTRSDMGALFYDKRIQFIRGDANIDKSLDISDPIYTFLHLFKGKEANCLDALDVNDDGKIDVSDSIYSLKYLFISGPSPPEPFIRNGIDQTIDDLTCNSYNN